MANSLAPFGFSQVGVLDGIAPTFAPIQRLISNANATKIYKTDPVTMSSGYIVQATAGTTQIDGIFIGCEYYSVSTSRKRFMPYWPGADATGDVLARVIAAPQGTFMVQANGQLLASHVGKNANFALGTGNVFTGLSGATLDVSTIATTNTLPFRIVSVLQSVLPINGSPPPASNGADLTTPYSYAVVTFNNQDFKSLTGL